MKNAEVAAALDELADLYELDEAVVYRVVAYRRAARAARESAVSIELLAEHGRLTELEGIGKTIEQKIEALMATGEIPAAAKLKGKFPGELVKFMGLPGLGAKTARKIHEELGVTSLKQLRGAAEAGELRSIPGLGPKAEQNILEALEAARKRPPAERRLLSDMLPLAERIIVDLRAHPAAGRVELAGSARRMTETCKDLDIIATSATPPELCEALSGSDLVRETKAIGDAGAKVVTHSGVGVDLRVAAPEQFGNLLQHLSGSKQHNIALREYAVGRGRHVSENG
ncbi:hypothetical protein LCGC14_2361890, partial [marine sediment metagenome]